MPSASLPPPALREATQNSTTTWQADLEALFHHAKDRFPDVVWDLGADEDPRSLQPNSSTESDQVWGHKAIVYARAPPSFQARYFSFRPPPISSPIPFSPSLNGTLQPQAQSALSLSSALELHPTAISRSPSPFRVASPSPSTGPGGILRLTTAINPTLFSNELEYLYTGKGFGVAFEFLFDTSEAREEGDAEEMRIDKLRKDLVFMWRSRLYSDVRIALSGTFSSSQNSDGPTTAIFSSHRFILVSRSSYFHSQLIAWGAPSLPKPGEPLTLRLPSPPFTPASLHFTLGFIYTGTLFFSHRTYDLETAFHIMRSATYLNLQTLYDEVQARIVQEMMHGLFHAFLEFSEYERITGGKWGTGGCRCRQCARRAPRVLEFALQDDVKNPHLEAGARRALVGMFGEGWCNAEFVGLAQKTRDTLLKGLAKRTTPMNVFALLFAAHHALGRLNAIIDAWADTVREMVMNARKVIDETICTKAEECFEQEEWIELMNADGIRFEDGERVEWIMDSIKRGLTEKNAPTVYQTLVSSILLRPHATETGATLLSTTSMVRQKVEITRVDVIRWMRKRWTSIKQAGGFNSLEGWALKEISDELEVGVEDLISPEQTSPNGPPAKTASRPSLGKSLGDNDSDSTSLRASVLNRNLSRPTRSVASSSASTISRVSTATATTVSRQPPPGPRPDSKLSPSSSSVYSHLTVDGKRTSTVVKTILTRKSSPRASIHTSVERPTSAALSVRSTISTRSHASTIRKPSAAAAQVASTTLRPPSSASKPRTPSAIERRESGASDTNVSFKTAGANSDVLLRPASARSRRMSSASTASNVSTRMSVSKSPTKPGMTSSKRPPPPPIPDNKSTTMKRSPSVASVRSTVSTTTTTKKATPVKKGPNLENQGPVASNATNPASPGRTIKGRSGGAIRTSGTAPSSGGASKANGSTLKRKGSADTITKSGVAKTSEKRGMAKQSPMRSGGASASDPLSTVPRGATLDIGIPCIISSKRKRFKAFARYIGEVEGELGPWVGVEVPAGDCPWTGGEADKLDGPQWNDGTWGGIRYFEIGGGGSEWEYADDRATRRRRVDGSRQGFDGGLGLKREGDTLSVDRAKRFRSASPAASDASNSESRGLFVRPQQVLYVVDAIGDL